MIEVREPIIAHGRPDEDPGRGADAPSTEDDGLVTHGRPDEDTGRAADGRSSGDDELVADGPSGDGAVLIVDNSLREGEQVPGLAFTAGERFRLLEALDGAGVNLVDLGIPAISGEDAVFCRDGARRLRRAVGGASIRSTVAEVRLAAELELPEVYVMFPFSEVHVERKFALGRRDLESLMDDVLLECVRLDLTVNLVAEDGARGSAALVGDLALRAAERGARRILFCDTVGTALPGPFGERVAALRNRLPKSCLLGVHCHDDFGLATANTLAAVEAGAEVASVTVNGLGERAGNACLHEVVLAVTQLLGRPCSVDLEALRPLSRLMEDLSAIVLSPLAAGVGRNAFLHESGIHVDGLLKDPLTYEGLHPERLGRHREHVLGSTTGTALLRHLLRAEGIEADPAALVSLRHAIRKEKRDQSRAACREALESYRRRLDEALAFPEGRWEALLRRLFPEEGGPSS